MREFVSLEALARTWRTDELRIRLAANAAGVLLFTLHGRPHADKNDLNLLGEAFHREQIGVASSARELRR